MMNRISNRRRCPTDESRRCAVRGKLLRPVCSTSTVYSSHPVTENGAVVKKVSGNGIYLHGLIVRVVWERKNSIDDFRGRGLLGVRKCSIIIEYLITQGIKNLVTEGLESITEKIIDILENPAFYFCISFLVNGIGNASIRRLRILVTGNSSTLARIIRKLIGLILHPRNGDILKKVPLAQNLNIELIQVLILE